MIKWLQFSSVAQLCPTPCDPMNHSRPGLPVHHQLPEFTQIHVHWVGDAIQPAHPLSSPCPPACNLSQHQGLIQWVGSSHQVAKVLELHLKSKGLQARQKVYSEGIDLGVSFQKWEKFSFQSALVLVFLLLHPSSLHSCSAFGNNFS